MFYKITQDFLWLLHCKHGNICVTSLKHRKLIVKLRNKDKLSIGDISKTVMESKIVIHNIEELGSSDPRNHLADFGQLQKGKTDGLVMNQKLSICDSNRYL